MMSDWRPDADILRDEVERQRNEILHLRQVVIQQRERINELERGATTSDRDV
jgi:hypothetical protein